MQIHCQHQRTQPELVNQLSELPFVTQSLSIHQPTLHLAANHMTIYDGHFLAKHQPAMVLDSQVLLKDSYVVAESASIQHHLDWTASICPVLVSPGHR